MKVKVLLITLLMGVLAQKAPNRLHRRKPAIYKMTVYQCATRVGFYFCDAGDRSVEPSKSYLKKGYCCSLYNTDTRCQHAPLEGIECTLPRYQPQD